MRKTRKASNLKLKASAAVAALAAFPRNMPIRLHEAVKVVEYMNTMGMQVVQAYLVFPLLMSTVVPIPKAMAARSWLETPNIGQMVEMLPERDREQQLVPL